MVMAVYPPEIAIKPPFTNFVNDHARALIFLMKWLHILGYISLNPKIHGKSVKFRLYPAEMLVKPPFTNFVNNNAKDFIFLIKWLYILGYISLNPYIQGNGGISCWNGGKTTVY